MPVTATERVTELVFNIMEPLPKLIWHQQLWNLVIKAMPDLFRVILLKFTSCTLQRKLHPAQLLKHVKLLLSLINNGTVLRG